MLSSSRALLLALLVIGVALFSPIEEMAHSLSSAHMVQHLLLILVAGPLLARSGAGTGAAEALPRGVRRTFGHWRHALGLSVMTTRRLFSPVLLWLLHTGTIWFWHAAGPYEAAIRNPFLHALEHFLFLSTAVMFWSVVGLGRRRETSGLGVLLVFAMAFQGVFLSALITFADAPWYRVYEDTTTAYRLDPLTDQQLAGAIMWVPAGLVYTGIGLALLMAWIREHETPPQLSRSRIL